MKSNVIGAYKEIQIHGPVEFGKDIERVYVSKDELKLGDAKALLQQVKTFCSKHQLEYELFENDKNPVTGVFGGRGLGMSITESQVPERIVAE